VGKDVTVKLNKWLDNAIIHMIFYTSTDRSKNEIGKLNALVAYVPLTDIDKYFDGAQTPFSSDGFIVNYKKISKEKLNDGYKHTLEFIIITKRNNDFIVCTIKLNGNQIISSNNQDSKLSATFEEPVIVKTTWNKISKKLSEFKK